MFEISSNNPTHASFYYPTILIFISFTTLVYFINYLYKKYKKNRIDTTQSYSLMTSLTLQEGYYYSDEFVKAKNSLKIRYLTAYVLTRASTWAKSPYLYIMYNQYHGFAINEIGVLYVIDAVAALISGPIFGGMADRYGRKLFCQLSGISAILNLALRLTANKQLAYLAQILTGLGGGLIITVFESWIVFEAQKEFGDKQVEKEKYMKRLFKNQTLYDAMASILVSALSAILYTHYGVTAPILFSVFLSGAGFLVIHFFWAENKPNSSSRNADYYNSFKEALGELNKRDVISVGIIESIWQACLSLFIFIWTPIMQLSHPEGQINVGFIFFCFVIVMVSGTAVFELLVINVKARYYMCMSFALFAELIASLAIFYIESFQVRLIAFAIINGICGFYPPVNSIVKSKILIEKHRAMLMNVFRVPLNLYVIILLLGLKYVSPFTIILISAIMLVVAFALSLSLLIYPPKVLEPAASTFVMEDNASAPLMDSDDTEEIVAKMEELQVIPPK